MRYIVFLLILSACIEEPKVKKQNCFEMIRISDALPVKFYLNGLPSFNQKKEAGIDKTCFYQPFNCEDELTIQAYNDTEDDIVLRIKDEEGETIDDITLTKIKETTKEISIDLQFSTTDFPGDLGDWSNANGSDMASSAGWIWGNTPNSARAWNGDESGLSNSKYLVINRNDGSGRGWPVGTYTIKFVGSNLSTTTDVSQVLNILVYGLDNTSSQTLLPASNSPATLPTTGELTEVIYTFTTTQYYDLLGFRFSRLGSPVGFSIDGRITSVELTQAPTEEEIFDFSIDQTSFIFEDLDICNKKVKFELIGRHPLTVASFKKELSPSYNYSGNYWTWDRGASAVVTRISGFQYLVNPFDALADSEYEFIINFKVEGGTNHKINLYCGLYDGTDFPTNSMGSFGLGTHEARIKISRDVPSIGFVIWTNHDGTNPIDNKVITISSILVMSDPIEIFFTDFIDVKDIHEDSRLISYTNEEPFAGIYYDRGSPVFHKRVKSKFYEQRFPEENESLDRGDGSVVKLSGSVKKQKLLEIEPCPPFDHENLKLILQHNSIFIGNRSWIKEEEYEVSKLNDRYALFLGSTWLTLADDNFNTNVF